MAPKGRRKPNAVTYEESNFYSLWVRTVDVPLLLNTFQFYSVALRRKTDALNVAFVVLLTRPLTHDRLISYPLIHDSRWPLSTDLPKHLICTVLLASSLRAFARAVPSASRTLFSPFSGKSLPIL